MVYLKSSRENLLEELILVDDLILSTFFSMGMKYNNANTFKVLIFFCEMISALYALKLIKFALD